MLTIKAKLRGTSNYEEDLKTKKVVLPISVGQTYHEGDKFLSTVELINKRFLSCDIIIADTLQRTNLDDYDPNTLIYSQEFQNGSAWIERNKKALSEIILPHEIIRWHQCLNSQNFYLRQKEVDSLYNFNQEYYNLVQQDVEKFLLRQNPEKIVSINMEAYKEYCVKYILEETAVFLSFFMERQYNIVLYPSAIPSSIDYIRKKVKDDNKNIRIESFILYFNKKERLKTK